MAFTPDARLDKAVTASIDPIKENVQKIYYGILGRGTDEETDASAETGEACTVFVTLNDAPDIGIAYYDPLVINMYGLEYGLSVAVQKRQGKPTVIGSWMSEAPITYNGQTPSAAWYAKAGSSTPITVNPQSTLTLAATAPLTVSGSGTTITHALTTPLVAQYGGTGRATLTANNILAGNGTDAVNLIAPGASGTVLRSNGTAASFTQLNISDVTGTLLTVAADSGSSQAITSGNTLTLTGGTGIDTVASATDTVTINIDSTVVTLTGTQTLTNKTLTSPTINAPVISGGTIDDAVIGGTTPDAATVTTLNTTLDATIGNNSGARNLYIRPGATDIATLGIGRDRTGDGESIITFISASGNPTNARIRRDGGTNASMSITNFGTGAMLIGTNGTTRIAINGSSGLVQVVNELELDGALNHDGTTVGFYGTTPTTKATSTTDLKDVLVNVGLLTDGGATPLVTDNGAVNVGTSYLGISAGSNAGNSRLWHDSTDKVMAFQTSVGLRTIIPGVFWKRASTLTTTSTSATSITTGTTWGTLAVPADQCVAGTILSFRFWGKLNQDSGNWFFDNSDTSL